MVKYLITFLMIKSWEPVAMVCLYSKKSIVYHINKIELHTIRNMLSPMHARIYELVFLYDVLVNYNN